MSKKRSELTGVYFTSTVNGTEKPFKVRKNSISLDLEVAIKVPYITPIVANEQWALKQPNASGLIPVSIEYNDIYTAEDLLELCCQLKELENDEPVAVEVVTEGQLWLADYLSLPLAVGSFSKVDLIEMIPLTLTETFRRLKQSVHVSRLWHCIVYHWQLHVIDLTENELKRIPLEFIKEYYLHVINQSAFRYPILFASQLNTSDGRIDMDDPFAENDSFLVRLINARKEAAECGKIADLFDLMLSMDHFSKAHDELHHVQSTIIDKNCSKDFLRILRTRTPSAINIKIVVATSLIVPLKNMDFIVRTQKGTVCFHFDDDRLLRSIRKFQDTSDVGGVALFHPCFSRFLEADDQGRLSYMLTTQEVAVQRQFNFFRFHASVYSKMSRLDPVEDVPDDEMESDDEDDF